MSEAYICDRCDKTVEGHANTYRENSGWGDLEFDLCPTCKKRLKTWLRNGGQ